MEPAAEWQTILFVEERYHTNQHPIIRALRKQGHTVEFLSLRKALSESYNELHPDFTEYSLLFRMSYNLLREGMDKGPFYRTVDNAVHKYGLPKIWWYLRYLDNTDPDLIVSKGYNLISYLTLPMAKARGIDIVFYDQDPVYCETAGSTSRGLARKIQSGVLQEPFVRYSPVLGDETVEKTSPNAHYLPFVAEPHPDGDDRDYVPDGTVRVVMVGKFTSPRKNHIPLVRAVNDLAAEYDLSLTLIGELENPENEYFQQVRQTVADSDLADAVDIRTNLSYDEVQQAYLDHDIYVLPSARERAAVSHLEAMAHGLPVIVSETNGTSCYVEPGKNGYLVPPSNRSSLRDALERLITDDIAGFGERSYELAATEYSGDKFYQRFTAILQEHFGRGAV